MIFQGETPSWSLPSKLDISSLAGHVPPALAAVLIKRGLDSPDKLNLLLYPPHRLPYDPLRIAGMDTALRRLYSAVNNQEQVGVFGDFDVDGITGTAVISEGLSSLGVPVTPYLPHRVEEGHGLSNNAIDVLADKGITLIITVDCGITSFDEVDYAKSRGVEVITVSYTHLTLPTILLV